MSAAPSDSRVTPTFRAQPFALVLTTRNTLLELIHVVRYQCVGKWNGVNANITYVSKDLPPCRTALILRLA